MALSIGSIFKNFGHAIATVAKYTATGIEDLIKVANKAQAIEPEVALVVGALAGPLAQQVTDLSFHALGSIAQALEGVGTDASAQVAAQGLNVPLDVQTINDIRAVLPQLKAILTALKGQITPAVPAAPAPPAA
jgi:hypothetical protein